jgi:hypothetical protein
MTPQSDKGLDKIIDLFATVLRKKWEYTKTPSGTSAQWKAARDSRHLFLQKGFVVWLAYFLIEKKCRGGGHYAGQSLDLATYNDFCELSEDCQDKVASALAVTEVHASVRSAAKELERTVKDQAKRDSRHCKSDLRFSI